MSLTTDIAAMYRTPRQVVRRLLSRGTDEGRALAILMAGCLVVFIAQWPRLSRDAHLTGEELSPLLGASLFAWLFLAPLIFYVIAFLSFLVLRTVRGKHDAWDARIALFWALLASGPLMLLNGLVAGFIGPGSALNVTGLLWFGVFLWFWGAGLSEAGKTQDEW